MLDRIKAFSLRHPFWFGIALFFCFALATALTYPVHFLFPDTTAGVLYGDTLSRLVVAGLLLAVIWRFGWLEASGLSNLRLGWGWLVVVVVLLYKSTAELYAFTGSLRAVPPTSSFQFAQWLYYFFGALNEEFVARCLVLVAMLVAWGATRNGILKSVLLSSLLFGGAHLFNAINTPLVPVLYQTFLALVPGILYASFYLATRSMWPAILLHWITNALVNTKIATLPGYTETPTVWTLWGIALIPLLFFRVYLLWRVPWPYELAGRGLGWADRPSLRSPACSETEEMA
jgi:membrane protease YdiL (CAAX protease family)